MIASRPETKHAKLAFMRRIRAIWLTLGRGSWRLPVIWPQAHECWNPGEQSRGSPGDRIDYRDNPVITSSRKRAIASSSLPAELAAASEQPRLHPA